MIKLAYVKEKTGFDSTDKHLAKMTHIAYSFAKVNDGFEAFVDFKYSDELAKFQELHPEIKVLIAIGGWGAGNFSEAVATKENLEKFVGSIMEIVNQYNFDGVDLDWEYPCFNDSNISSNTRDRVNFTLLVGLLRARLGENKSISFACGGLHKMIDSYEFAKLYELTDFMNLMSYDMGGSFNSTGHQTNLYYSEQTNQYGADDFVKFFDSLGYKKDKINIGCAFYARGASGLTSYNDGILCEYINGEEGLYFDYHDVLKLIEENDIEVKYDEKASAVYFKHEDTFYTFDDPRTILNKLKYVTKHELAGIMFWEHVTDKSRTLIETIINYEG